MFVGVGETSERTLTVCGEDRRDEEMNYVAWLCCWGGGRYLDMPAGWKLTDITYTGKGGNMVYIKQGS